MGDFQSVNVSEEPSQVQINTSGCWQGFTSLSYKCPSLYIATFICIQLSYQQTARIKCFLLVVYFNMRDGFSYVFTNEPNEISEIGKDSQPLTPVNLLNSNDVALFSFLIPLSASLAFVPFFPPFFQRTLNLRQGIHVPIFCPTCHPTSEVGSDIGP